MMKVLHITASPLVPNSGITVVLDELSSGQNKIEGVTSKVLSLKDELKQVHSPNFIYKNISNADEYLVEYSPDVAIIHSFYHIEFMKIANMLKNHNIPFFIEPHGSFGKQAMKKSHLKKLVANSTIFKSQIKDSIGYIFTNKAEYEDSYYRTKNELIIPNGIVPEIVYSAKEKMQQSFSKPTIYFLGRYDVHHKGLDYLFDALDILEKKQIEIRVNLYGTGSESQIEYVKRRVQNYKKLLVNDCGTIYGNDKKNALEFCNILILTSRYEGSPMTVLDGLSYGNPCIATPGTNIADEVVENDIGWRTELSAESIAQTIIKALEEYRNKGELYYHKCRKYVLDNYSWEKIGRYSIEQYKNTLSL